MLPSIKKITFIKEGNQFYSIPPTSRVLKTCIELNRDKVFDEAIFMLMCARNHFKLGSTITGKVRFDLAKHKLDTISNYLNKKD
jgi:hypothetical protein